MDVDTTGGSKILLFKFGLEQYHRHRVMVIAIRDEHVGPMTC